MKYKVRLKSFEGPFDLLVYLIENAKMDIYDIKVSEITEQYLEYIREMKNLDVEFTSDFMVLAAQLINIKSKMLLPRIDKDGDIIQDDDPRADLVERILEYKRYKMASELLAALEDEGGKIYQKPQEDISQFTDDPDEILDFDSEKLMDAFQVMLGKKAKLSEIKKNYENVQKKKITAEARVEFIKSLFEKDPNKTITFSKTVNDVDDKYDIALSFTSVMEMVKQNQINASQERLFGEILISKGENYDNEKEN